MSHDVVVVGGGPAGAALANSLAQRNVDVVVLSPTTPWNATYGSWRDDVSEAELGCPLDDVLRDGWNTVRVVGKREHLLQRPYVVFDNVRLRSALLRDVAVHEGAANGVTHGGNSSTVHLTDGTTLEAALVVDATGSGVLLAPRDNGASAAPRDHAGAQTAFGLLVDANTARLVGVQPEVFTLMDWSRPPTFLYGAPFADGSVLLEETSLYANPPRPIDQLEARLSARLGDGASTRGDGTPATTYGSERVTIPMGDPLPMRTTRVVGFGASAGYVHPVTGYSVAASLRAAPRVAGAIQFHLARQQTGSGLALAVWNAVWPVAHVRARAWHEMGLEVLQSLPDAAVAEFFDAFFSLPTHQWSAYLRIDASPSEVRRAMLGVFRRVGAATRFRLMSSPGALLRAIAAR